MFTETMYVEAAHFGLVIGPKGSGIQRLREMPGVQRVQFDTRRYPGPACPLIIRGASRQACMAALAEVTSRIEANNKWILKRMDVNKLPDVSRLYLPEGTGEGSLVLQNEKQLPPLKHLQVMSRKPRGNFFATDIRTSAGSLSDHLASLSMSSGENVSKSGFRAYSRQDAVSAIEAALQVFRSIKTSNSTLELALSPGKESFYVSNGDAASQIQLPMRAGGHISQNQLDARKVRPIFHSFPSASLKPVLSRQLTRAGYQLMNPLGGQLESFTIVHLVAGVELLFASVALAVDTNLETLSADADPRLSKEKSDAVEKILRATTIGDVLPGPGSLKLNFRTLSLQVHPDKNSHPGATEAMKRLNDSYQRLSKGEDKTKRVLAVGTPVIPDKAAKPPKVISVKIHKKKLCTLTTVGTEGLDLRARLVTFTEDKDGIGDRIRNVLSNCWENRDPDGGIADPEGKTGIVLKMVKQVTSAMYYAKEVELHGEQELVEVVIKEMRMKEIREREWRPCIEVDIKLVELEARTRELGAEEIVDRWELLRDCWLEIARGL